MVCSAPLNAIIIIITVTIIIIIIIVVKAGSWSVVKPSTAMAWAYLPNTIQLSSQNSTTVDTAEERQRATNRDVEADG